LYFISIGVVSLTGIDSMSFRANLLLDGQIRVLGCPEQLEWINTLVDTTLNKKEVIEQVEEYFGRRTERESPC
jgi:hypothetical protein